MRISAAKTWTGRLTTFFTAGWLLLAPLTLPTASGLRAAETAAPTPIAASIDDNLKRIFAGTAPSSVNDLRAMQSHVQRLTEQLDKCTVGVTVGNAQGSGVIISKDGFVLTAAHVAGKPNQRVVFTLDDGREVSGKTLGLNKSWDAGLMKIEDAGEYAFAEMGTSEALKEGQWCLATGHPGGYQEDRGMVLRVGRVILLPNSDTKAITSDCTLVGGDSGGPLFDMEGRVIGINSRIAGQLVANMHVPVSTFKETWERLNKGEAWGHYPGQEPVLGVRGEENSTNAKVAHVFPKSPAAKAGLKVGDVVLKLNGLRIDTFQALRDQVALHEPNETVKLAVQRGEETLEIEVKLGRRGE